MTIYNSDGSEPEMCGNGIRCLARFVADVDKDERGKKYNVSTLAGLIVPEVREDGQVAVDMGTPILRASNVPSTLKDCERSHEMTVDGEKWLANAVGMGNPHCVVYKKANGEMISDAVRLRLAENRPDFRKARNVPGENKHRVCSSRGQRTGENARLGTRGRVHFSLWHRRVRYRRRRGHRRPRRQKVRRRVTGGPLEIEWREIDDKIIMTGPAEPTFEGTTALGV